MLPDEIENLLLYLLRSHLSSARTLEALHSLCPEGARIDEALAWSIDNGYVHANVGSYDLTAAGSRTARQIQEQVQAGQSMPTRTVRIDQNSEVHASLPSLETHPLRTRGQRGSQQKLRYLLAFDTQQNVLPIPLRNDDILGRLSDANINFAHDEFISGHHCRFRIQTANDQPSLLIEDLGSRNGTYVDGIRLQPGQVWELKPGNRIRLGATLLIVVKIPD